MSRIPTKEMEAQMGNSNLIYDLGLHNGEDTEFYLKKGFRVVAIDANPELCARAAEKFKGHVADGRLHIVNKAISTERGVLTFYRNELSEWGTIDPAWAKRNERRGKHSQELQVDAVPFEDVIAEFGLPYFVKIDIEGMDMVALRSLRAATGRPTYVSIESEKISFTKLREEFETLLELGYDRFKLVRQDKVPNQRPPNPAREGAYVEHQFEAGASGLFGEEAPGKWLTSEQAIEAYKPIFLRYHLIGDDPLLKRNIVRVVRRLGYHPGWYDTHAKLAGS